MIRARRQFAVAAKPLDECSRTCSGVPAADSRCHCLPSASAACGERAQTFPGPDPRPPLAIHTEPGLPCTAGRCDRQALEDQAPAHRSSRLCRLHGQTLAHGAGGAVRPGWGRERTFSWGDRCAVAHFGAAEASSVSIGHERLVSLCHLRSDCPSMKSYGRAEHQSGDALSACAIRQTSNSAGSMRCANGPATDQPPAGRLSGSLRCHGDRT